MIRILVLHIFLQLMCHRPLMCNFLSALPFHLNKVIQNEENKNELFKILENQIATKERHLEIKNFNVINININSAKLRQIKQIKTISAKLR